jgi:transcriptional regulator with XRE-family HTH domain
MGKLYDLIQEHIDRQPHGVSERRVARSIGVTQTTLANWREPKRLISKDHLRSISRVTGVPYQRVLDALLEDIGYLREEDSRHGAPTNVSALSEPASKVAGDDLIGLPNVAHKPRNKGA